MEILLSILTSLVMVSYLRIYHASGHFETFRTPIFHVLSEGRIFYVLYRAEKQFNLFDLYKQTL